MTFFLKTVLKIVGNVRLNIRGRRKLFFGKIYSIAISFSIFINRNKQEQNIDTIVKLYYVYTCLINIQTRFCQKQSFYLFFYAELFSFCDCITIYGSPFANTSLGCFNWVFSFLFPCSFISPIAILHFNPLNQNFVHLRERAKFNLIKNLGTNN